MALTRSQVEKIADLARLQISEDEIPTYVANLSKIIDFVDQLENARTDHVEPMAHPLDASQRLRPDAVTEPDQRERFRAEANRLLARLDVVTETDERDRYQQNASETEAGLYLVPKVIE